MRRSILCGLSACVMLTASCARQAPVLPDANGSLMPPEARRPCALHVLPDAPSLADLEVGYMSRGAQLAACDAARRLAVEAYDAQVTMAQAR